MVSSQPVVRRGRKLALAVLCAQTLMIILDQTIVNVALPSIRDDLGFSPAGLAWVLNAYLVAFGGLLLLSGRLGDLFGRRRIFLAGLVVFTAASLACGLAWNAEVLVVARFVQGVGGAASSAVVLGMIVRLFPEPAARAKAIGVFSFVQAAGGSIGSVAGGLLTEIAGWHWIFLVNVPIGVVAALAAARVLDREPGSGSGADVLGSVLGTAALMLAVYTVVGLERESAFRTLACAVVTFVLLALFVVRQARARNPLLPLRLFRSRTLTATNVVQLLTVAAAFGFQFLIVLYLRQVLGFSAERTGAAMLPAALAIAVVSLVVSAPVTRRFGERHVLVAGLVLMTAAMALLARLPAGGFYPVDVLPPLLGLGLGFGLAMPAMMALGMSDARDEDAGLASGLFNTTQQIAGALGLSVLAVVAASRTGSLEALTSGYRLAFTVATGLVLAAVVVTAFVLVPRRGGATR